MALAIDRSGTVFKRCDRSNHKPESNKKCAAGACQHTCEPSAIEKCPHAWTLRYWVNDRQVERSFRDATNESTGRVIYGSGRKLARDFQLQTTVDKRSGDITFADHGKTGKVNFGEACEGYISRLGSAGDNSKEQYRRNYRTHIQPVFGDRSLAQVARDRDGVMDLLAVTMKDKSLSVRTITRLVIVGTCDEAVRSGKLGRHRLADIELADNGPKKLHSDFVFPTHAQVVIVADGTANPDTGRALQGAGICVWLMRGCGLRVEEALAVEKSDFKEDGTVLRVTWQASRDGRTKTPLKHRKRGEYRDVPVPAWLWEMVRDMPDGPLMPGPNGKTFHAYTSVHHRFTNAARAAGIPDGFTPHSLRHAYASALLAQVVPITDVSKWLGHKNINVTYATYGHLVPSAAKRAVAALDAEFAEWSGEAA